MARTLFIAVLTLTFYTGFGYAPAGDNWALLIRNSQPHLTGIAGRGNMLLAPADSFVRIAVDESGEDFLPDELVTIIDVATQYCSTSPLAATQLMKWLREDHPVYRKRSATFANQFHCFVLASLAKFPVTDELYSHVRYEFLFADHAINIAAAAIAARKLKEKASELIPLMEPYLSNGGNDEWVDITTPELTYPIAHPSKARYEILLTLQAYGAAAYRSVVLLSKMQTSPEDYSLRNDTLLNNGIAATIAYLQSVTPLCCRKDQGEEIPAATSLTLIPQQSRQPFTGKGTSLTDQDGRHLKWSALKGKPFVLAFFYTQCTNASKCASTVNRLGKLQAACNKNSLGSRTGIYAMTYDPDFDTPDVMKKYGSMYGVVFGENMKFVRTAGNSTVLQSEELPLRVNYGGGSVNQHGIQLFIFDKQGKIAAVFDNNRWDVDEVINCLLSLVKE